MRSVGSSASSCAARWSSNRQSSGRRRWLCAESSLPSCWNFRGCTTAHSSPRASLVAVQDDVKKFEQEQAIAAEKRRAQSKVIMAQMVRQRDAHLAHKQRVRARQLEEERAYVLCWPPQLGGGPP